jgi:hypothetical protein
MTDNHAEKLASCASYGSLIAKYRLKPTTVKALTIYSKLHGVPTKEINISVKDIVLEVDHLASIRYPRKNASVKNINIKNIPTTVPTVATS